MQDTNRYRHRNQSSVFSVFLCVNAHADTVNYRLIRNYKWNTLSWRVDVMAVCDDMTCTTKDIDDAFLRSMLTYQRHIVLHSHSNFFSCRFDLFHFRRLFFVLLCIRCCFFLSLRSEWMKHKPTTKTYIAMYTRMKMKNSTTHLHITHSV